MYDVMLLMFVVALILEVTWINFKSLKEMLNKSIGTGALLVDIRNLCEG